MLLGTFWEHVGNLMRSSWEHDGNTLGKKGEKKIPLPHPSKRKKLYHS
jgi:hypothetical protein